MKILYTENDLILADLDENNYCTAKIIVRGKDSKKCGDVEYTAFRYYSTLGNAIIGFAQRAMRDADSTLGDYVAEYQAVSERLLHSVGQKGAR